MDPNPDGKYSTCDKFCTTSCFGKCTPNANCPHDRNGTCKEIGGLPDLSGGACCQKARLSNGVEVSCTDPFSPEQLSLLNAPADDGKKPKIVAECCCSPHVCTKTKAAPPPARAPPAKKPPVLPPQDDPKNITIGADVYQNLQVQRALWMKTEAPKASATVPTPPPVTGMPSLRPSNARKGNCLVYAPHGCKPGDNNPYPGQAFPVSRAAKEWTVIGKYDPKKNKSNSEIDFKQTYGIETCLQNTRMQWTKVCNSHPDEIGKELHPIFTLFCVDDKQCFSDPDCVRNPAGCAGRANK